MIEESSERRSTFLAAKSRKIRCRSQGLRGNEKESFLICFLISRGRAYWVLQALHTHPYLYVRIRYARLCGRSRRVKDTGNTGWWWVQTHRSSFQGGKVASDWYFHSETAYGLRKKGISQFLCFSQLR